MTNFILKDPKAVFIHLPKTGGTSVRTAFGGIEGRFFGHIPNKFIHLKSFAVIREPKARFLSAFRMFKFGNKLDGDYYSQPRWPDLTISKALDVIEDPWIGFDRSQRVLPWNLKHHIIPQTHPFNCLSYAKNLLRFETLEVDFLRICAEMGVSAELPKLRISLGEGAVEDSWCQADEVRFSKLFAGDYHELGYGDDIQPLDAKAQFFGSTKHVDQTVFGLWSVYFSDQKIFLESATDALPCENSNLEVFADEIIPGDPNGAWAGRSKDFIDHFHQLQPEFSGSSRLSHLLACTIVVLRRDPECERAIALFWRIMDEQFDVIRSEFSLRWLVAISDTVADFGRNSGECAIGMSASVYANAAKLHESELKLFYPNRPWPPQKRFSSGGKLFDGMLTYWVEKGDLIENMFLRSSRIANLEPVAGKVLAEVIERLKSGPTVYRRFNRISGKTPAPILEDEIKKKIQRIMKKNL